MTKLEEIVKGASVKGILPNEEIIIVDDTWYGTDAKEIVYKTRLGKTGSQLLYRTDEKLFEISKKVSHWTFDAEGEKFRLVSEAVRIKNAYLFDPLLAVHSSLIEPLPHQITAVYDKMLQRQPLRFLLADDPGAGKTIMAGLLIKELMVRGAVKRCLICCPGNLVEQWQDELYYKFHLPFEIITSEKIEISPSGNPYTEYNLVISRLDHMSRDPEVQARLEQTDWDLIVCDEAHKMSASFFGGEIKETKRYKLGKLLSRRCRHFLLLTATPHNGKEEEFQLFLALLDQDRFEGRFREGVHVIDPSDIMRRLSKEQLLKFDGTRLFPERLAYTVTYNLSNMELELYNQVTNYVRDEMNRADRLTEGRKNVVGFALTILQRRLASSPESIYQSLRRRRERLEKRLQEVREKNLDDNEIGTLTGSLTQEDVSDLEDSPEEESTNIQQRIVDQASAAETVQELEAEILTLQNLESSALKVRHSGTDRKWEELSKLLQNEPEMYDSQGSRRKLIIFTEYLDTLNYLSSKLRTLIGKPEAITTIHGALSRDQRRTAQEAFTQNKDVAILVATDAAGEGINLQRGHLMVDYDLPWNPNRIEQRFGRIHRIGQTEVCHLWNLVAPQTREGDVFKRLLEKLEIERQTLGGQVFDVLGKIFDEEPLKDLLLEAIRYGDRPDVRAKLYEKVDAVMNKDHIVDLLEERALARESLDPSMLTKIREQMERIEARKLQPYFIAAYFHQAFGTLGGSMKERESKRYELTYVPSTIRNRSREISTRQPVLEKYERITFEKALINIPGKPVAEFISPGHPLLDAIIDLNLEQYNELLRRGTILVDPVDNSSKVRILFYLDSTIQDARTDQSGNKYTVSKELQFVEVDESGNVSRAGYAPYLDYRPLMEVESKLISNILSSEWLNTDLEQLALSYAVRTLVPDHYERTRKIREELIQKTRRAVHERLTKEISYWDRRANELKDQELQGKVNARINSGLARKRADELELRLRKRILDLEEEQKLSRSPPFVIGGALIVPIGLLHNMKHEEIPQYAHNTRESELPAIQKVLETEKTLGHHPVDVSAEKCGYDIESRIPGTGKLRFIEVKGRVPGAPIVTVTKNEILTSLNKPDDFVLCIVPVENGIAGDPCYIKKPFTKEPDFGVTSINYDLNGLLERCEERK